jgi:hypothetical protein
VATSAPGTHLSQGLLDVGAASPAPNLKRAWRPVAATASLLWTWTRGCWGLPGLCPGLASHRGPPLAASSAVVKGVSRRRSLFLLQRQRDSNSRPRLARQASVAEPGLTLAERLGLQA